MNLNSISTKLQQLAEFMCRATRSSLLILTCATIAAASGAAVFVAFRLIWHVTKLILKALGV